MNEWAMVPCPQLVEGRRLADADFHTRKRPVVFAHCWEWLKVLESPPWQFLKPQWRKQNIELMNWRYSTLPFGCGFFCWYIKDLSVEDVCLTSYASQCLHFVGRCDFRCWIHRNLPMVFFSASSGIRSSESGNAGKNRRATVPWIHLQQGGLVTGIL